MPLVPATEIDRLRRQAAYHKRQLYEHREGLRRTMQELAVLEAARPEDGGPTTQTGEGAIHGPDRPGSHS